MKLLRLVVVFIFAVFGSNSANAQAIVLDVAGSADIPLALPKPELPAAGEPKAASEEVWDAVWTDLSMSGYFQMQDPKGYVEKAKGVEPNQFDFAAWKMTNTTVLVKTRVWPAGHASCDPGGTRMCADVWVYHVPTGNK